MKIALIFPRLVGQVHGMWPPLGIITLGAILKQAGHDVRCHDTSFDDDLTRVIGEMAKFKPDLVGVSCLTDFFPNAAEIVKKAKDLSAVTVMGGPHPTILGPETMEAVPELDYAVKGEADESFPALVEAVEKNQSPSKIPGIIFREGAELVDTGKPQRVKDLDKAPVPDRDILDVHPEYLRARAVNMHASRGCPFKCKFCQPTLERMFGRAVRFQSPARVTAEIKACHEKYGVTEYFFHDDTFTISKKWMRGLVDELGKAGLLKGFRYVVNSRVDTFDAEKAAILKDMGVYYVLFGIESGSQKVLDSIGKGTTVEQAREAYGICRDFGFRTHAYVLLGSPSETKETLAETEKLVEELRPNTVHISIFTPLIGTDLAQELENEGRILVKDFTDLDYYLEKSKSGSAPISIPGLSYQDLIDSRARMLDKRRLRVFIDNLRQLVKDVVREPKLDKFIFRYRFYQRMRHYFG